MKIGQIINGAPGFWHVSVTVVIILVTLMFSSLPPCSAKKNTVLHYIAFLLFLLTVLPKSDFECSSVNENTYRAAVWILSFSALLASLESLGVVRSYAWLKSFPRRFWLRVIFFGRPKYRTKVLKVLEKRSFESFGTWFFQSFHNSCGDFTVSFEVFSSEVSIFQNKFRQHRQI